MGASAIDTLAIPENICASQESFEGDSKFKLLLIASEAGHPPAGEEAVYAVLEQLGKNTAIEWVFVSLDAVINSGFATVGQTELQLEPYRAFSDTEIKKEISEFMVRNGLISAAVGFGIGSPTPVHVQPYDDIYLWAVCRDALNRLNYESGKLEAILSVIQALLPQDGARNHLFDNLLALIRLEWTASEWLENKSSIESLDILHVLSQISVEVAGLDSLEPLLSRYKHAACDFYEASVERTNMLVERATQQMHRASATTGALIVALPLVDHAAAKLKEKKTAFVRITPSRLSDVPILDRAKNLLEGSDDNTKLADLFSGKKIRSRIEVMEDNEREVFQRRSQDWTAVCQGLELEYQESYDRELLSKMEICAARALEYWPENPNAWCYKGLVLSERREKEGAIEFTKRAISLSPRDSRFWLYLGSVYDKHGNSRLARKALASAIYRSPRDGLIWNYLGVHLHKNGSRRAGCYCLNKAAKFKDANAKSNYDMVCGGSDSRLSCPLRVLPPIVYLMSKVVLPLRFNWKDVALEAGIIAGLLFVIATGVYGAIHGARAAGVMGGIIGAVASIITAALVCLAGLIISTGIDAASGEEKQKGLRLSFGALLAMSGAIYGAMLAAQVGANALGGAWTKVGQVLGGLLGAALGSVVAVFVFAILAGILGNPNKDGSHAEAGKT